MPKKTAKKAPKKQVAKKKTASKRSAPAPKKTTSTKKTAIKKKTASKKTASKKAGKTKVAKEPKKVTEIPAPEKTIPFDGGQPPSEEQRNGGGWFSGLSSGVQETITKLLNQVSPEVRANLMKQARDHGPRAVMMAVDAAARKTRNPKAKIALRTVGGLLRLFVSSDTKR